MYDIHIGILQLAIDSKKNNLLGAYYLISKCIINNED